MNRETIKELQSRRLKKILEYVYENNSLYRKKFRLRGLKPTSIKSSEDLSKLFFTTKKELRDAYPFGFLCVPKEKIVRIQMSGGTTGSPVIIPYSQEDVEQWKEMMVRDFKLAGVTRKDVIQIAPAFGLWNGGFGFHFGAEAIGCFVIPIGPGNTRNQLRFMKDFGTSVFCSTASYPLRLAEVAEEIGFDLRELKLKKMILGAEPWSEAMRKKIENTFNVKTFDIPGLTEMGGVGCTGMECAFHEGIHIWEDQYIVEVVDPDTGEILEEGKEGELVYTTLTRCAMPLIRYRSGEISSILSKERCKCGLSFMRIARIKGRTDDMIIYKGVKFYPSEVEEILAKYNISQYQLVISKEIKLLIESSCNDISKINEDIKEFIGFMPQIELLPPHALKRYDGKTPRIVRK